MEHNVFISKKPFATEAGFILPEVKITYTTFGSYHPEKNNVIWICHALTANSNPSEWWPGLVGDGFLYNSKDHFIVCANVLGSCYGTSGPTETNTESGEPYYLDFPLVSIRDMVYAHELLRTHLGIKKINTCIGGSLGGQQALEWSIIQPDLIENLILLATNAVHSPWGIAFNEAQRMAIKSDPTWQNRSQDAGLNGMGAARSIALLSYRSYDSYEKRQKEESNDTIKDFKAISYQQYQAEKLKKRFNCHSYLFLSMAMDTHNVSRNRGALTKVLSEIKSNTLVIGISSDVLFPVSEQLFLAKYIPQAQYKEIDSIYGHDGFLVEVKQIESIIRSFYSPSNQKILVNRS